MFKEDRQIGISVFNCPICGIPLQIVYNDIGTDFYYQIIMGTVVTYSEFICRNCHNKVSFGKREQFNEEQSSNAN